MPVNYESVIHLSDDGVATVTTSIADGTSTTDSATWEFVDGEHWNLNLNIPADTSTPGLEEGAVDVSEYEVVAFDNGRMQLAKFDFEFPFVYERIG
jgi:hypothetical protein